MSSDTFKILQNIDPAVLTRMVQQDQNNPSFEIMDWSVEPISHAAIIGTTGGIFRFKGLGRDASGNRPWSIALKISNNPRTGCQEPDEWCYWKREALAFESGLLSGLPAGARAPRCYGVTETSEGAWLWMEHITEATDRVWSLDHYHRAARYSGRFSGGYLLGAAVPQAPWFTRFLRSIYADGGWWATMMNPESPENAWQNQTVAEAFADPLRSKVLRVWAEKYRFFDALDKLPQVFCHFDFHRRNLILGKDAEGNDELIAVDWAFCGPGAIGADLGGLIATSTYFFEFDPTQVGELEATVLDGYLAGLRDVSWSGDPELTRLGYLISAVLWIGASLPGWAVFSTLPNNNSEKLYGRLPEAVIAGWVILCEFLMERADETRFLMTKLGVG